jgi:hypothetical protein
LLKVALNTIKQTNKQTFYHSGNCPSTHPYMSWYKMYSLSTYKLQHMFYTV